MEGDDEPADEEYVRCSMNDAEAADTSRYNCLSCAPYCSGPIIGSTSAGSQPPPMLESGDPPMEVARDSRIVAEAAVVTVVAVLGFFSFFIHPIAGERADAVTDEDGGVEDEAEAEDG